MTSNLASAVRVERRFALSARLDTDLNGTPPLTGYVLQSSVRKSLETMLAGIAEGQQYSFTWTGPYGGGKSCAALLVANLVAGNKKQRLLADSIVDAELAAKFSEAFSGRGKKWKVLALTGRRENLSAAMAETAADAFGWSADQRREAKASDRRLIDELEAVAGDGGLLVIIDELGKFLEYAMGDGDVHLLQDLAERAARSGGKLVVTGILHQSFEQYADRAGRMARNEWAKVQGRFQNVPFLAQPDEVAALLARAIVSDGAPQKAISLATDTASAVGKRRPVDHAQLAAVLADTWPLHPVTSLLLGPVSRQRFAQNERSVFGFLSSAEPNGFQAFLANTAIESGRLFGPDKLWDYLVSNFGSALVVGPEGHRMTLAMEAIERASLQGEVAARIAKCAAIIELFRNGSGVAVADDFLELSCDDVSPAEVARSLDDLVQRAILIKQPRLGGYALFAGSDFNIDEEMSRISTSFDDATMLDLPARVGVGPIAGKSHYFETGALRTLDVVLQFADGADEGQDKWAAATASTIKRRVGSSTGLLVVLVPDMRIDETRQDAFGALLAEKLETANILAAVAVARSGNLRERALDLNAIDHIEKGHPRIEGDRLARRELSARRSQLIDAVHNELSDAFLTCKWWVMGTREIELDGRPPSVVVSSVCATAFADAPRIRSELLNRNKPSSSAMAGLRALLHAMVAHPDVADLGIANYPAERGLYLTILSPLGLHRQDSEGIWRFSDPGGTADSASLVPAWELLRGKKVNLGTLFDTWASRPYGIKRGVMPALALAYLQANRNEAAVYVDGHYQAVIDDLVADKLLQDPGGVEFRHVARSERDQEFLLRLANLLSTDDKPVEPTALPVASSLFQRYRALPLWAQRTSHLDDRARKIRDIVLRASDPEALLFSDLDAAVRMETDPAAAIAAALLKAETLYPAMIHDLKLRLAKHLGVNPNTFEGLGLRASTAGGVTGELRLDAFIVRVGEFEGEKGDIEGLASLLVHKPPRNWTDLEQEAALFELAKLAHRFRDAEAYAAVKGREPTAKAISVMVGMDPDREPMFHSFLVSEEEHAAADDLANELIEAIKGKRLRSTVSLTALARIVERLAEVQETEEP